MLDELAFFLQNTPIPGSVAFNQRRPVGAGIEFRQKESGTLSQLSKESWLQEPGFLATMRHLGDRLAAGHQTLDLITQVRILVPQLFFISVPGKRRDQERLLCRSCGLCVSSGSTGIPAGLDLYGLGVLGGKNPREKEFVSLDNEGRLSIYDDTGKVEWKSENLYGGSATAGQSSAEEPSPAGKERARLPLRLMTKDLNNDQKEDILLGKNFSEAKGLIRRKSAPEGGSIYALQWNGHDTDTRWQTERLGEAVVDYGIGDADNDGKDELVVGVREGRSRLTLRSQNYILIYEIS